jgi:tetratricopeptide (TPR) repeat protein
MTVWFILLPVAVVGVVWFALGASSDHLARQGRYDLALRLAPLVALRGAGRSYLLGDVLTDAGRYKETERMLREAIKCPKVLKVDTAMALEDLGNVLMDTESFEEAQRSFREAAEILPNHSPWATGMAEVLLRQGICPQNALLHAETALNLFRGNSAERIGNGCRVGTILATKAWALAACDRSAEAREAIDAALKSPARKTKGPLAQIHYKPGMCLLQLSDRPGARKHFVHGAQIDPSGRWGRLCASALKRQGV